nr:MAG TPA: RloB-like protein [Caudoviricetes sp.]
MHLYRVLRYEAMRLCFEYYFLLYYKLYTMNCNYYCHSNSRLKIKIQDY